MVNAREQATDTCIQTQSMDGQQPPVPRTAPEHHRMKQPTSILGARRRQCSLAAQLGQGESSHASPEKKRKDKNSGLSFTIFEDSTATEDNLTRHMDERYEEWMEYIYKLVNTSVKKVAFKVARGASQWACLIAEGMERVMGGLSLRQRLLEFLEHLNQYSEQAIPSTDEMEKWNCFPSCISRLAGLMREFIDEYENAKQIPEGASIQMIKSTSYRYEVFIISGYCVGKGCGLESPRVLQPGGDKPDSLHGKDYYTNLAQDFNTIFSVFSDWNFLGLGDAISSVDRIKRPPSWVSQIVNGIQNASYIDLGTKTFLLDRWARRQLWIDKKIFGEESRGQKPHIDQLRIFHRGKENIPAPLLSRWLTGRYRTPGQAIRAMAAEFDIGVVQMLWHIGERPPPNVGWEYCDFPAIRTTNPPRTDEQDRGRRRGYIEEGIMLQSFR